MVKVCSLFSGSSGNCIFISSGTTSLLVDAGVSGKRIEEAIVSIGECMDKVSAIIITHEHSDHISGAGILARRHKIPIYANEATWSAMKPFLGKLQPQFIKTTQINERFTVGDIEIVPFPIPHDAACPVGYNFFIEDKKFTVATDIGHVSNDLLAHLEKSLMILLESNHDIEMLKTGSYPWPLKKRIMGDYGHLCNELSGKVVAHLAEKGTKYFLLGHLSKENNFPELAYQTVCNALTEKCIVPNRDVYLDVAHRDRVSKVICF
jgi:phosphoribosyl 1,2-cyclic phosphodiesterase